MHAIVRQGNGKYYISAVFGYYRDITAKDDYQRYLESIHKPYWIVWNPTKNRLIRWLDMTPNTGYLIPQILIVDSDHRDWNTDEDGVGCVDFLSRELLDSFLDAKKQPEDILAKCHAMDDGYEYDEMHEVRTQKDVVDLKWASGNFHDAFIIKEELQDDGTLYLRFDGIWGCQIEVWFWGDLKYDTSIIHSEEVIPYWIDSTLILQDGFVYFIGDYVDSEEIEDITEGKIRAECCYFKARHMKYRIIPD